MEDLGKNMTGAVKSTVSFCLSVSSPAGSVDLKDVFWGENQATLRLLEECFPVDAYGDDICMLLIAFVAGNADGSPSPPGFQPPAKSSLGRFDKDNCISYTVPLTHLNFLKLPTQDRRVAIISFINDAIVALEGRARKKSLVIDFVRLKQDLDIFATKFLQLKV